MHIIDQKDSNNFHGYRSDHVIAPKLGYQFLCCYSFLALIFKIFLLSLLHDSENSCHFQPFKTLLMSLSVGKTSFASSQTLIPNFWNLNMPFLVTKEPSFSLICWSSQLFLEITLSFWTLDMQKYCQVPCNIFELWFIPFLAFFRNKIQRHS